MIKVETVNYNNFRKNLKKYFKTINDDSESLIVTNKNPKNNVVFLSKDESNTLTETLKIESNKYLINKIRRGQKEVKKGKTQQHELIESEREDPKA